MGTKVGDCTFILFPENTFGQGFGGLVDFTGALNYYRISETPEMADRRAMAADWRAVGEDMRAAIAEYRKVVEEAPGEEIVTGY